MSTEPRPSRTASSDDLPPRQGLVAQGAGASLRAGLARLAACFGLGAPAREPRRGLRGPGRIRTPAPRTTGPEAEERFRIVFEHSLDGILTLWPDGTVHACNPAAARILGCSARELVGTRLSERVAPRQAGAAPFPVGSYETTARRDGSAPFPVELTVSASPAGGRTQLVVMLRDVTERKATQDRLSYLANYDSLTGLPNRVLFRDRLDGAMKRALRSGRQVGLMFLDLDRFKVVNDSLGHAAGDLLLQQVSRTLTRCLRMVDTVSRNVDGIDPVTVSRLGGDEFTIIFEDLHGPEDAALIAQRILDALIEPFRIEGQEIFVTTSIGISLYPRDDSDLDGLIRHTDMAMYRSKSLGGGVYSFYSDDLSAQVEARLELEAHLRHALERNEFVLHYQPKADLHTGEVAGVEALLRWSRPGEGMVPPDRFIAMLEDTGLILPVGAWVIRTACAELAKWDRMGLPPLALAVNISARQFREHHLKQLIADTLLDLGLEPQRLELELTESQLMDDNDRSRLLLASLAELGVKVAIDDFGTGHSSLSYLKRFAIDTLKIDRSFVREITQSDEDHAIAAAVVALGRSLGLRVVAEGVETLHQADCLRALGCDQIQGYLLSRPLPADKLVAWLRDYRSTRSLLRGGRPPATHSGPLPLLSLEELPASP